MIEGFGGSAELQWLFLQMEDIHLFVPIAKERRNSHVAVIRGKCVRVLPSAAAQPPKERVWEELQFGSTLCTRIRHLSRMKRDHRTWNGCSACRAKPTKLRIPRLVFAPSSTISSFAGLESQLLRILAWG